MWEEGMNTKRLKPQTYYKNKHASTPQASKRKKGNQMKTICTLEYREVENTHTKYTNITKTHIQKSIHTQEKQTQY